MPAGGQPRAQVAHQRSAGLQVGAARRSGGLASARRHPCRHTAGSGRPCPSLDEPKGRGMGGCASGQAAHQQVASAAPHAGGSARCRPHVALRGRMPIDGPSRFPAAVMAAAASGPDMPQNCKACAGVPSKRATRIRRWRCSWHAVSACCCCWAVRQSGRHRQLGRPAGRGRIMRAGPAAEWLAAAAQAQLLAPAARCRMDGSPFGATKSRRTCCGCPEQL